MDLGGRTVLSRRGVTETGFRLIIGFIGLFYPRPQFALLTVTTSLSLLGSGFQRWTLKTSTVVYVIAAKFKPLIFSEWGFALKLKLKLNSDRRSVGQCVLVSRSHLELMSRFFFSV
jgi:hypothetical protein